MRSDIVSWMRLACKRRQVWLSRTAQVVGIMLALLMLFACSSIPKIDPNLTAVNLQPSGALDSLALGTTYSALGKRRHVRNYHIERLEREVARDGKASNWNKLAEGYLAMKDFPRAAYAYYKESNLYAKRGDMNTSLALLRYAQQYETTATIFIRKPTDLQDVNQYYSGARLEPKYGCYTGAFIDHETSIPYHHFDNDFRRDVAKFNERTGVHHSTYFIYLGYGKPFPQQWIDHLKENGAAAQLAFEPTSYAQVKDDEYLRNFARKAKASGVPIFLRFASEMNGDWVVYHKSPQRYIEMFRLVAKVMHQEAPNVAMIWCPFEIPQRYITEFYPGKEAVDWVGVNIYSVLYNDNDSRRNAQNRNPADALKFIYNKYSKIHPIMIGEYGASNMSSLDMVPRSDYAITKIEQFYNSLPRLYPRVKAVHWLSMNAIQHAYPGRQLNNYSLLDDPDVTKAYKDVNACPYFLKNFAPEAVSPVEYEALHSEIQLKGNVELSGWVKTYDNQPTVIWCMNGKELNRDAMPGAYPISINTAKFPNGKNKLEMVVLDEKGYEVCRRTRTVEIQN